MTKYICNECEGPCILKIEEDDDAPSQCPYNREAYPEWELMKEDQKMIEIECELFRENGKWYTTELVSIPADTPDWNIPNIVKANRRVTDFIYVGKMRNNVPFLIPIDVENNNND